MISSHKPLFYNFGVHVSKWERLCECAVLNRKCEISFYRVDSFATKAYSRRISSLGFFITFKPSCAIISRKRPSIQSTKISPREITIAGTSRKRTRPLFWITALGCFIFYPSISNQLKNAIKLILVATWNYAKRNCMFRSPPGGHPL